MARDVLERFLAKVRVGSGDECWLWTGAKGKRGYGSFKAERVMSAHRFAFLEYCQEIPSGMFVCHRCDNPSCVNPDHLFFFIHADNMRDMDAKGRRPVGDSCASSKLTDAEVKQVLEMAIRRVPQEEIAKAFGISRSHVAGIKAGSKRRMVAGTRDPSRKLTRDAVEQIRARAVGGESRASLAAEFGISSAHVSKIRLGRAWPDERVEKASGR